MPTTDDEEDCQKSGCCTKHKQPAIHCVTVVQAGLGPRHTRFTVSTRFVLILGLLFVLHEVLLLVLLYPILRIGFAAVSCALFLTALCGMERRVESHQARYSINRH